MSNENQNPNQYPLGEPSVLDYVRSLFRSGKGDRIQIPDFLEDEQVSAASQQFVTGTITQDVGQESAAMQAAASKAFHVVTPFPWRSLLALALAFLGQRLFEPPPTTYPLGYAFYIAALMMLVWAIWRGEWTLPLYAPQSETGDPQTYRLIPLILSVLLAISAYFMFRDNLFTKANLFIWLMSVFLFMAAFWLNRSGLRRMFENTRAFFMRDPWTINISRWTLFLVAATALVFFFRFYQTTTVPPEPFSDHAEKLYDVYDVSQGETHVFFIRNTGREAIQMYWTLWVANIFGTGLSFLSLKLGTAILGFLTLPFIYLLGKEIGGRRVGLIAFILAGIAYWPNVISRVGLRFPLYPLFVAPTLFFLLRGLRTRNRNDFLLSGLFLGIGLHGYSPFRIMPFVVVAAFIVYWLHERSQLARRESVIWLTLIALTSFLVFIPLLRFWMDHPDDFGFRAMSRLSGVENPITQPIWQVFFTNVWNAFRMFNFDDGVIWVNSVADRPALDVISAALFIFGVVLVLVRYIRNRHWLDLFLLVSIPVLLLPSILSLAYPNENPALNRAGGAYIPVFILGAMALDGLASAIGWGGRRAVVSWALMAILLWVSARQNYDLVFNQYYNIFRNSSWNTSDMGRVIKDFENTYGTTETVWVVPWPFWVDTRLPAAWAGIPNRDLAIQTDQLTDTLQLAGPKLFMFKANVEDPAANDQQSMDVLKMLYPQGQLRLFDSDVPGHDFWIFTVPN